MQNTYSTGPILPGNLLNILQRLALTDQDVRLLQVETAGKIGELWACGKDIISARLGSKTGIKALSAILELDKGEFALLASAQTPIVHFHEPIQELYLEPEISEEDRELARVMSEANETKEVPHQGTHKLSLWQRFCRKRQNFAATA